MKVLLTDRFCQHAKSTTPQTDYFDETIPGLALRVTSKGVKAWTYHHGKPRRRTTLGRYPTISLAAARGLALEVAEGRRGGSMTVAELVEAYLAKHIASNRSAPNVTRRLRTDVVPIIGNVAIAGLHRRDITRVLDAKYAPIAARRVFEDVRGMIRWAVSRGDLDHNPIDGMKGPAISKARERVLSDEEIKTIWSAPHPYQTIIRLCLLTAQRVGEVAGLRRNEIDLQRSLWLLPGSRTKNGHPHSVPLSPPALEIVTAALGEGEGEAIFPTIRTSNQISTRINRNQCGLTQQWTAHDIRRTVLTRMAELGIPPIVRGHIANHRTTTKAGMTLAVYDQYSYEKEKREALDLWADRLRAIVSGTPAEVVPLRGRA